MNDTLTNPAETLDELLQLCMDKEASDLHLAPGLPPHYRVHGELLPEPGYAPLTAEAARQLATELQARMTRRLTGPALDIDSLLGKKGSVDGAITSRGGARFRFNFFLRQAEIAIALRLLEDRFYSLQELGLPDSLYNFCELPDGLIIISGPTGAGKSTTLATLLDRINRTRPGHLITIEDPIEYLHAPIQCVINQRQVGLDAASFNEALVASLRQDPDVVLVGEIRDLDTIRTAITAAETGHLVFTTLHAGDCVGSVERLVSVFPADEQDGIRRQLSLVLRGIVAQHLLPAEKSFATRHPRPVRRVVASEILTATPAVANLIAMGKSMQIYSAMEAGGALGMQTLEQDLARLWVGGRISETTALALARNAGILRDRAELLRRKNMPGGNGMSR